MSEGASLYRNPRVAAGYAFDRPPLHERILERVARQLRLRGRVPRALDAGCGAGRSTAALSQLAATVVGIDPAAAMLEHHQAVAPGAHFVVGKTEHLPFPDAAFNLMTAAGSINYTNLDLALPELARVLAPDGVFVVYDFSAGRRLGDGPELEEWHAEFRRRYPDAPGYELDVTHLSWASAGLILDGYEEFEVPIPMTFDAYLRYAMSETRIQRAVSAGVREDDVRSWCAETLRPIFPGSAPRAVVFDAYTACVKHAVAR